MQAVKARITRALPVGTEIETCDNSGAKVLRIFTVFGHKTRKRRRQEAGVGDLVMASVKRGRPEMRKQVVLAVIVRQRREYRRSNGMRIAFEDNAAVVCKDEDGNPKGTMFKGPIAKEVCDRWAPIAKLASIIV
ncbi:50S ribosomal protein L14 [Candidatus Woesearchaeota archaeon]|nr:50S ribosomal protein L14 [Candidatus Woesearchaeota archaeon]